MLPNDLLLDLSNHNYTEAQFFQFGISFLFLPIVITLATATMVCAMKRYWVDKYNQGDDIGIDYLEKFSENQVRNSITTKPVIINTIKE